VRPRIGSDYRPARYERRTPVEYQCLRPEFSRDQITLQTALCPTRIPRIRSWTLLDVLGPLAVIVLLVAFVRFA